MKFAGLLVIFALLHFVAAPSAEADSVLVGNSFVNLGLAVSSSEFLAQPFVLTASANVTSIDVSFIGDANSGFEIDLTDALGSGANVLAHGFFASALAFNTPPNTFVVPVDLSLTPGTYYIVASTPAGFAGGGWIEGGSPSVGDIPHLLFSNYPENDKAFPPASQWARTNETADFQVIGTSAQNVPEPPTILLLLVDFRLRTWRVTGAKVVLIRRHSRPG